ncbi:MAG: U32 family peptidase [Planctomycetes bacterium]|nr:U32 family peptidase [Planctomycetota bacterium]
MKFSLATNFDDALIEQVRPFPVKELFGKLSKDIAGGGRATYQIVGIDRRRVKQHVELAHRNGIGFNYLLNAACLDNLEFTRGGQKSIRGLLGWVCDIGCESVTVSSPFLLRIVKECYPQLRVRVSVFATVDHVRKAKMWEDLGADCLMLDSILVNREFEVLKAIRKGVKCELQLMVSNNCMQSCAMSPYHMNTLAHASQSGHHTKGFFIDWCFLKCTQMKLLDPVNYIRSEWIRPEDLHHYEALGYDSFKITERGAPTAALVGRVRAWSERRYDGNLLDLVQPFGFDLARPGDGAMGLWWRLKHLFRPFTVSLKKMWNVKKLAEERGMLGTREGAAPVTIDNRALDGFIGRFLTAGCKDVDCETCRHCHRWAEKSVKIDPEYKRKCLKLYEEIFADMHSGRMWGLVPSNGAVPMPEAAAMDVKAKPETT